MRIFTSSVAIFALAATGAIAQGNGNGKGNGNGNQGNGNGGPPLCYTCLICWARQSHQCSGAPDLPTDTKL